MAQHPQNPRLFAMYVAQAKTHFDVYPSPAASHWVHEHYVKAGGRFVETDEKSEARRRETEKRHREVHHKKRRGEKK
jgi:hypothetical protein